MHPTGTLMDYFVYQLCNFNRKPYLHSHTEFEIYYFHGGRCEYFVEGDTMDLSPGDLIIIDGISRHGSLMKEACSRTMIRFDGAYVRSLLQQEDSIDLLRPFYAAKHYRWHLSASQRQDAEDILLRMNRFHREPGFVSFHRLRTAFQDLLLFIYDCWTASSGSAADTVDLKAKRIHQLIKYIETNYMNDLTLDRIADHLFINKFYLVKLFKETTGQTIFEYVNKCRINKAKLLFLMDKDRSVTEVCYEVGFHQPAHFSRNFKQIVGVNPDRFRKLLH
ncbi:MAG: AraC family transcriptional regulator [Paenibacillus sp.]|jgi:AraC-like DNA-binding protein|nr:AraC family transcriptional regulator [Paenibacillus sp.]